MTQTAQPTDTGTRLWNTPAYRAWFTADTATAVGVALRSLAISLIGYALSGSTAAAGWLGSAAAIAQQVCAVFGGTFVDRHDRKLLIIVNAVAGLACWGGVTGLLMAGRLTYPVLLGIAVACSAVNGFLGPASDAMLKSIVSARNYPKARSLNEGRDAAVNMAGSPVGGFLFSVTPWLPFLATAVMYAVAGVAAVGIRRPNRAANGAKEAAGHSLRTALTSFARDFSQGWAWSLRRRMLLAVMVSSALLNFGINGLQYGIQLHLMSTGVDATAIGFINTGVFVAMLLGAFIAGKLSDRAPVGPVVCASFIFVCVAALPLVWSDAYWVVLVANAVACLPFPIVNALMLGFVFAKTPDDMQGRVTVSLSVPAQVLSAFSSAAAGSFLPAVGYRWTMAIFVAVMAVSAVIILRFRPLRTIPSAVEWEHTPLV
ncbi:MFS transporter [Bifidobacterium cuniculi]|uniref:Major facilitator superfamily protein n=1 Tax=Bifidobacterium cuniculi TaxID=1688 RepID=A0A087ATA0_9BIFI|nr:MFS transporter [Bifidobacterium cuniculi]KFI62000.1 major facilitator superfamily protein [Bifidobacterium cuniculi]